MKAVILAGGLGTRMGDETADRPKPLVEVGKHPILWHVLKIYEAQGIDDFVVCAGHAGQQIEEYFTQDRGERWRVRVVDTGEAGTGGRLRRVRNVIGDETFFLTYADGVADINLSALLAFHRERARLVTVTAVEPISPFGVIRFSENEAGTVGFKEKPRLEGVWVNSGFFVVEPAALDFIDHDEQAWENGPLERIADKGQLSAFKHVGFWQCMDTPRDRQVLEELWREGRARWRVW